jgi:hypothetical protein
MSFAVYNCYKLNTIDPFEIQQLLNKFLDKASNINKSNALKQLGKDYVKIIDNNINTREEVFKTLYSNSLEVYDKNNHRRDKNLFEFMMNSINDRVKKQQITVRRDPLYDFNYTIYLHIIDSEHLKELDYKGNPFSIIRFSTETKLHNSLFTELLKSGKIEDFHYQNSSDIPNNISEDEWDFRYNVLDRITSDNAPKPLSMSLYTSFYDNIFDWNDYRDKRTMFTLLTLLPSLEERRKNLYNKWYIDSEMEKTKESRIQELNKTIKKDTDSEKYKEALNGLMMNMYYDASEKFRNIDKDIIKKESEKMFSHLKEIDLDFLYNYELSE